MSAIYRRINPKKVRLQDFVQVNGHLESVCGIEIYPPVDRTEEERPPLCPIRPDWWAVAVHTPSGATEWLAEPELPGPR